MADKDFDYSKISKARNKEEWQKAFDEFSEFLASGKADTPSSASPESPIQKPVRGSSSSPRATSPKPKNIHAGHRQRLRDSASNNADLLGFTDIEVLETLLSYFIPYKDTNPIAHALLDKFGTLSDVLHASPRELLAVGSMTHTTAEMLPIIADLPLHAHKFNIKLDTHRAATEFFASMFLGGASDGIYVAFLDKHYRLIAVERHSAAKDGSVKVRAILGAVAKHGAKSVIVARRERGFVVTDDKVLKSMGLIRDAFRYTDIKLLDCMIFLDYGYYSTLMSDDYVFLPILGATGAPELADAILANRT